VERKPVITAVALLLCWSVAAPAALAWQVDSSVASLVGAANQLRGALKDREALDQYLKVLAIEPDHFEALSAAAYLYGKVGSHLERREEQEDYFGEAVILAERALEQAPDHPESNFVMAWAYGAVAMISTGREKIEAGKHVYDYVNRVLEQREDDDRAWYVLGNLNYEAAGASVLEKAAARILYGGLPPNLTNRNAIQAYSRAVELRPGSILYRFELARVLARLGRYKAAREHLDHALSLDPLVEGDDSLLEQCSKLRKKLRG
jgi:tetratricopeptide (TPR) repeat protein